MSKKVFNVIVTLPDLAAAHAEHVIKVESANWSSAVRLACEEVSRRPHVLGKHIKSAKITFSIVAGNPSASPEGGKSDARAAAEQGEADQRLLFDI